ncbi:hypothetical protein NQ317_008597 [Molorchus minor]|uniref:Uncharacterized protein n=1 Tax=Molorchus minor TaxID=1323400 RepID=A0ABQ9JDA0_9CUCU|nr:hypothetical protein NQ317_008597 [Molorchus minor]
MSGNKTMSKLKSENRRLTRELEQIKRGQQESIREVEKARDVMDDYEKKVALLHQQALKSSKILKQSKDRFCKCLKEKENLIEDLQNNNKDLTFCITEKDLQYRDLNKAYENLQVVCEQNDNKCEVLSGNNKKFCECIQMLEKQLQSSLHESQQYKEEIKKVEQRLANFKCTTCQRLEEKFENRLKEYEEKENMLKKQNADLTSKIKEIGPEKVEEFKKKIMDYETCVAKCKHLEEECKNQCDTILRNEKQFEKERGDLMQLVDELTTVVKQNKVTLLQLSSINKEQEVLLETQSVILLEKKE